MDEYGDRDLRRFERPAEPGPSGDTYDRVIGRIDGLSGVTKTKPSSFSSVVPMLGRAQTYVVQTYKTEDGFFGFVQMMSAEGSTRFVLPPKAMASLYRQRDSLIKRARSTRAKDRWHDLPLEKREAAVARLRRRSEEP